MTIDGTVSSDRKEAIRNKMMILDKEYAKSRIQIEQSPSENKWDDLSSHYFKVREEPQSMKLIKYKTEEGETKIDEETSENLNFR